MHIALLYIKQNREETQLKHDLGIASNKLSRGSVTLKDL